MYMCSAQELQARVQKGLEGLRGSTEVKLKAGRRLLAGVDGVGSTDPFAATSAALNGELSRDSPMHASALLGEGLLHAASVSAERHSCTALAGHLPLDRHLSPGVCMLRWVMPVMPLSALDDMQLTV